MLGQKMPEFNAKDWFSASKLNKMSRAIERVARTTADSSIEVDVTSTGRKFRLRRNDRFFAAITSGANPYAWSEAERGVGGWSFHPSGRSGTIAVQPAYEANRLAGIMPGKIVELTPGAQGEWLFEFNRTGSGGGSSCPNTKICVTVATCLTGALSGQVVTIKNPAGTVISTCTTSATGICPCVTVTSAGLYTISIAVTSEFQAVANIQVLVSCGNTYNQTITIFHKSSLSITYTCCCPNHISAFGPLTLSDGVGTCVLTKTALFPDTFTGCTLHPSQQFASSNCSNPGPCTAADVGTVPIYWTLVLLDSAAHPATDCATLTGSIYMVDQPGTLTCIFSASGCVPDPQTTCGGNLCSNQIVFSTSGLTCAPFSITFSGDLSNVANDFPPYSVTPGFGAGCNVGNIGGSDFVTFYPWKKIFGNTITVTITE